MKDERWLDHGPFGGGDQARQRRLAAERLIVDSAWRAGDRMWRRLGADVATGVERLFERARITGGELKRDQDAA